MLRRAKLGLAALLSGLTVAVLAGAMVGGEDAVAPAAPGQPTQTTPRPDGKPVVLAFGGDVHFEGVLESKLAADPSGMLDPIEPVFRRADLAVVNLETAVTTGGSPTVKAFTFRTPATAFAALRGGRCRSRVDGEQPRARLRRRGPARLARRGEALPLPRRRDRAERRPGVQAVPGDREGPEDRGHRGHAGAGRRADQRLDGRPRQARPRLRERRAQARPGGPRCARDLRHRGRVPPLGHRARAVPVRGSTATREGRSSPPEPTSSSVRTPIASREPAGWARRSSATGSATSSGTGRASSRRRPASCS